MRKISLLFVLFSIAIILSSCAVQTNNELEADGRLIVITHEDIDIDKIKNRDDNYKEIDVVCIDSEHIDDFEFRDNDMKAVDSTLLDETNVKNIILDSLKDEYVLFIGNSDISTLKAQLGHDITIYKDIYSSQTQERITHELISSSYNQYSIFKYTENNDLKEGIEYIYMTSTDDFANYLIPCFDIFVQKDQTSNNEISQMKYYLTHNETGKTTTNYITVCYSLYKDTNEQDSKKDYYTIKTEAFFKDNGSELTVEYNPSYESHPYILNIHPTSMQETSSYEYKEENIEIQYEGPFSHIALTQDNAYNPQWIFKTKTSQDLYQSENILSCMCEYAVDQDAHFSINISISGSDVTGAEIEKQAEIIY